MYVQLSDREMTHIASLSDRDEEGVIFHETAPTKEIAQFAPH